MSAERLDRKVTVILATDVAAYSKHVEQDESLTIKTYSEREAVLLKLIGDFRGRVFNTAGDSVLAEFASAVDAVECAAAFQVQMVAINSQPVTKCKLEFRIGINMGDVVQKDGNLLGDGVNIAARLEALSQPNGVSVSKSIHDLVAPKTNLVFNDLGIQKIKENEFHAFDLMMKHSKKRSKSIGLRGKLMLGGGAFFVMAIFLAAAMILAETASPSSASSARSAGDITASPRSSSKPASRNFSAVAGPTPGRSSMVTLTSSSSVIGMTSSSTGASFFSTSMLTFFFDFGFLLSFLLFLISLIKHFPYFTRKFIICHII